MIFSPWAVGTPFASKLTFTVFLKIPIIKKTFARYPNYVKLQKLHQIPPKTF